MERLKDEWQEELHRLFRRLALDDDAEPQEVLEDFLHLRSLEKRISCLRYLNDEFKDGHWEAIRKYRHETEYHSFPTLVDGEEWYYTDFIESTLGKFKNVLEEFVPSHLAHLEQRRNRLTVSYTGPVKIAEDILAQVQEEVRENEKPLRSDEAAKYLDVSLSKLYKMPWLSRKLQGSNLLYYDRNVLDAYLRGEVPKPSPPNSIDKYPISEQRFKRGKKK